MKLLVALAAISAASAQSSIVDIAAGSPEQFSTLVAALTAADLVDVLSGDGPFTVFAPTNKAFEKLPAGTVESLLQPENKQALIDILTYHVVPGKVLSTDLSDGLEAVTVQGDVVEFTVKPDKIKVNDARVTTADVEASNGVIHVINCVEINQCVGCCVAVLARSNSARTRRKILISTQVINSVLLPPMNNDAPTYKPTSKPVKADPVYAPTYRPTSGPAGGIALGKRCDTSKDDQCANDVPCIGYLEPRGNKGKCLDEATCNPKKFHCGRQNIVQTAQATDALSTLVQAVIAADLVDTLSGDGPFTVFAPTNDAFAALGSTVDDLLKPENKDALTRILLYHVVPGTVLSTDLTEGDVATAQGETVEVTLDPIAINGAGVAIPDVLATNGVVHVIDAVLSPPEGL